MGETLTMSHQTEGGGGGGGEPIKTGTAPYRLVDHCTMKKVIREFPIREKASTIKTNLLKNQSGNQCCGSMTFWCGSGSADLCL
jgi:hypothetical protein